MNKNEDKNTKDTKDFKCKTGDYIALTFTTMTHFNVEKLQTVVNILDNGEYDFDITTAVGRLPLCYNEIEQIVTKKENPEYWL